MMEQSEAKIILEKLSAPFTRTVAGKVYPAHKWLPQNKVGNDKFVCTPYIDRDLVIKRLNEVLGLKGWQFEIRLEADMSKTGILSIFVEGDWITRSDTGTKSNVESEKGSTSDALKRAATHFGIGTYLYTLPKFFIDAKPSNGGKLTPIDKNGRFLYGDNLSNYINGMSTDQGLLAQLLMSRPQLWEREEIKNLWNELQ